MAALLTPAVLLPLLTAGAGVGGTLLASGLFSWFKGRKGGAAQTPALPAGLNLPDLSSNPILQHIVAGVIAQAHASGHAALDAVVAGICAKVFPAATPVVVPVVNKIVEDAESKLAGPQA